MTLWSAWARSAINNYIPMKASADGSSAAALYLVAALAEHPHDHVEAQPLNAPTAKPHATLQLSPATVTTDGFATSLLRRSAVYG